MLVASKTQHWQN